MFLPERLRTYRLLLVIPALIAFAGCRVGNYVKNAPGAGSISGYYETLINPSINVCATRPVVQPNGATQDQTNCATIAASHADWVFSYVMTDPVNLEFDPSTNFFFFAPNNDPNPFLKIPVLSDGAGNLGFAGAMDGFITPMQSHPSCQFNVSFTESGKYGPGTLTTNSTLPVLGRISMNFVWDYQPAGDCSQILNCYNDPNQCSAQDQQVVQQEYGPFVQAGVLNLSELPKVEKLEYQVSYQ